MTLAKLDAQGFVLSTVTPQAGTESYYTERGYVELPSLPPSDEHKLVGGAWVLDEVKHNNMASMAVRFRRDRMLAASDWTQLPDVPLATKEAWATYRQALRDVTAQSGFPDTVEWPAPPV